ncbi:MAG TPA: glycosyltransferase [Rhodopila sp.]|nr:glycosyltransferase [Rhodopila sp.]
MSSGSRSSVLRTVVGIPTIGRPAILREVLKEITLQTRPPDGVIICGSTPADIHGVQDICPAVTLLLSEPGLPRQRNTIMRAVRQADLVVFFDDDFLPHPDYLQVIERVMLADPRTVVATGSVLADGIGGPGLTPHVGRAILSGISRSRQNVSTTFSGYGCNMAVRLEPVRTHDVWFDERLPLYAWQEDVDFCRRLAAFGSVIRADAACGVHLGVKSGRGSGLRLGYSQVANPLYLARKRAGYPLRRALSQIGRNVAMNIAMSPMPEPHVDRRGRLTGNALALWDLIAGRMVPERILEL